MRHGSRKKLALALSACTFVTASGTWAGMPMQALAAKTGVQQAESKQATLKNLTGTGSDESGLLPDQETLFAGYVDQVFGIGGHTARLRSIAANKLSGNAKKVYDILKAGVAEVASGSRTSTEFRIPVTEFLDKLEYTEADLGVSIYNPDSQKWNDAAVQKLQDMVGMPDEAFHEVLLALLNDCPYELYWYNKSAAGSFNYAWPTIHQSYDSTGAKLSLAPDAAFTVSFTVDAAYGTGTAYQTNADKTSAAVTAANNAKKIVQEAASMSDYQKLVYYRQKICELTSYNDEAAANKPADNKNPWQMIYVFDGDPNTNVVCEGYSKAFQYLCDMTTFDNEIYSYLVSGTMQGGTGAGPHMWNVVHVCDNGNYLVDVTNCDTGSVGADDGLFLTGYAQGTLETGYTIQLPSTTISYIYDEDMKKIYSEEDLTLASGGKLDEAAVHTHSWTDSGTIAATCTEPGRKVSTCATCGKEKTEEIAAIGHAYEAAFHWSENNDACTVTLTCKNDPSHRVADISGTVSSKIKTPATCTAKGTTTYTVTASQDGASYTDSKEVENLEIDLTNHTGGTETKNQISPTSTAAGYTGDTYCKACGTKISSGTSIPATGTSSGGSSTGSPSVGGSSGWYPSVGPGNNTNTGSSQTTPSKPDTAEDLTKPDTVKNPDGSITTTVTKKDDSGKLIESRETTTQQVDASTTKTTETVTTQAGTEKTETTTEKKADGTTVTTQVITSIDQKVTTAVTTVNTDGSATKEVNTAEKNSTGNAVAVTTTTKTDSSGNVTNVVKQSVIEDPAENAVISVAVESGGTGAVLGAQASVNKTVESGNTAMLTGSMISQIKEAAGQNVTVTMFVKDTDGNDKYELKADTQDLSAGNVLYIYQQDAKTGEYVMVNAKTYKVGETGSISVSMAENKTYQLVNTSLSEKINRSILKTVTAKKSSATVKKGKSIHLGFNSKLNMDNVKKIRYTTSKKAIVKVSANGKITAKKTGSATVKAKVTLKNGTVKTVSMKIKVR